jgi:hypothetical protein
MAYYKVHWVPLVNTLMYHRVLVMNGDECLNWLSYFHIGWLILGTLKLHFHFWEQRQVRLGCPLSKVHFRALLSAINSRIKRMAQRQSKIDLFISLLTVETCTGSNKNKQRVRVFGLTKQVRWAVSVGTRFKCRTVYRLSWPRFSSVPSGECRDGTVKYATIASFQILTYSPFMITFPFHSTLYNPCRWVIVVK